MAEEKEFLSLEEVADLLGVTYQTIYRLARSGEMPAVRLGKLFRVKRGDLNAYLEKSKLAAEGGTCSVCNTFYRSRGSLAHVCEHEGCEAVICFDCWTRRGVRTCLEHGGAKA